MITLEVQGMSCQHCVASVTEALRKVPGVTGVSVSLETASAVVQGTPDPEALKRAVAAVGFTPGKAE